MDYHKDNTVYRSTWNTILPRVPIAESRYSMNFNCVREFRQNTKPRTTAYSAALTRARKQRRDRARMATFILKKTAENLPFGSLSDEDLRKLGTNTSLHGKIRVPTVSVSTQTEEGDATHVPDKVETVRLLQKVEALDDRLYIAQQAVVGATAQWRRAEEKLLEKDDQLAALKRTDEWLECEIYALRKELDDIECEKRQLEGYCVKYQEQISEAQANIHFLQLTLEQYKQDQQTRSQNSFLGYKRGRGNYRAY